MFEGEFSIIFHGSPGCGCLESDRIGPLSRQGNPTRIQWDLIAAKCEFHIQLVAHVEVGYTLTH